jgi:PAS domain S-box-containing protein
VSIDAGGAIVEFDAGAERMLGHRAIDVLGQPMAEVIIPGPLRAMHADGMARFLRTGEAFLIGRTADLTALHADGSVLPVTLSLMITSRDPLVITGVLRTT